VAVNALAATLGPLFPSHPARDRLDAAHGFSLIETMVVMALAAGLVVLAAPSMAQLGDSIRLTAASNAFLSHLYLARSEAIKRRGRIVLCKSADGVSCASGGGWDQGRLVFHDLNNNGVLDRGEPVLASEERLHSSLRMTGNQNVGRYVSFDPTGTTRLVGGGFQAGTVTLCRQSLGRGEARQIILNALGRPRVHKAAVDECV
jgi:type IV fimbrial biogenesis protein FimT